MVTIAFHSHATTYDNEAKLASGHNQAMLSAKGKAEAKAMGLQHKSEDFEAIFCSDLTRACDTARLAFSKQFPIFKDKRLRECDYGSFTLKPNNLVQAERVSRINQPFPGGESYAQVVERVKSFLEELSTNYQNKKVMIIGHGGTRFALEHLINGLTLRDCLKTLKKDTSAVYFELK